MKILFYNIGYGTGLNGSKINYLLKIWRYLWTPIFNKKDVADILKKINADIMCLAETDAGSIRHRFFSQIKKIANSVNAPYYSSSPKYHPESLLKFIPIVRKQHDAILSKIEGKSKKHYLEKGTKKLIQEFVVNNISIFTVHLGLFRKKVRKNQLKEIADLLKKCPRSYILCGDFNIFKGLSEVQSFIKNAGVKLVNLPATFPSCNPKKHLDLFFTSPDIKVKNSGIFDTEYSDHLPIWVEI